MRKLNQFLALAAAVTLAAAVRTAPAADPPGGTPNIAIANLDKIRDSLAEWKDVRAQMDLEANNVKQEAQQKETNLKAEKDALAFLNSNTQAYVDKNAQYEHDNIEAQIWLKEKQNSLDRNLKSHLKQIFLEIQDAVAQVAQKDGYSLVIADQRPAIPDNIEDMTLNELQGRISTRSVLFSDQSRDISGEVITLLDKNYAAKAAAPTPNVAPAPAH
jgi:Skp family chaperone for outer membrane proteins